eukprot:TRINITY_DN15200_c0_g1_i1.p1 TRINITY_DN15200_c0_g1~~TRINITY_DN15200_c0_g1_i1.p1  ORF type:complete len:218 (+),score=70.27 TRINITY_DN15200_c0_g1_i1:36-656(+)
MELSQDILSGLAAVASKQGFPDDAFQALVRSTLAVAVNKSTEESIQASPAVAKLDPISVKQGHAALLSLFLEGAKLNSDAVVLKEVLDGAKFDEERVAFVTQAFTESKTALRTHLSTVGFNFPAIVGVDWRLDYYIKSNTLEKINVPLYLIAINTKKNKDASASEDPDSSTEEQIKFTCSLEQLQDLVTRLKDAVKQVERTATALS